MKAKRLSHRPKALDASKRRGSWRKAGATWLLPGLADKATGRTPIAYARSYFRKKIAAPFTSPQAQDFDFTVLTPLEVRVPSRDRRQVASAIENQLHDLGLYLSNFLTHPRYGPQKEVGFARGDTIRPLDLRESRKGVYTFTARGIVVGRRDLFRFLAGRSKDRHAVAPSPPPSSAPAGALDITINMPRAPEASDIGSAEWYDFHPSSWHRKFPRHPLLGLAIRLRPRVHRPVIAPQYKRLYGKGVVRIALLFGYDQHGHTAAQDARAISKIVTAPPTHRFTGRETGTYGYHGRGLGFSNPIGGDFHQPDGKTPAVFRRQGIRVRYPGSRPGSKIDAEIRLHNFDKSSRLSSTDLIEQFVSVFRDNDIIHYDGHANYGGGFFIGDRVNDILWATDIGSYRRDFTRDYQIFSIGACHAAGYFADLFYHELSPRKSPENLDVVAAINETDFADGVHVALDLISNLLQLDEPMRENPLDYQPLLIELNRPAAFQAYIGVFGQPVGNPPGQRRHQQ